MNKYGNRKIKTARGTYDSEMEVARELFLRNRQNAGEITNLRRQVEYLLIPKQVGKRIVQLKTKTKEVEYLIERPCAYVADFVYERNGETIVEDCKGQGVKRKGKRTFSTQTEAFKIKKKLMLYVHNIQIHIVSHPTEW